MVFGIASTIVIVFALLVIFGSFFTVKSGNAAAILRFGKFHRTVQAGLHFKLPFVESKTEITLRTQQIALSMETKTKDNVFVTVPVSVQYSVIPDQLLKALFSVADPKAQIASILYNILLGHIPSMDLDEVYLKQPETAVQMTAELDRAAQQFGYSIQRVLITDIEPSKDVRQAMDNINIANRNQISARAQGEADRIKVVAAAQAQAEAKKLQGQGIADERIAIARGFKEAIEMIKESADVPGEEAYSMLLFTNWTDMLSAVGTSPNSTVVFVPSGPGGLADFQQQMMSSTVLSRALANKR
jgi:regulator of protease activity HflC (stomatin/prohibitin superfamily)